MASKSSHATQKNKFFSTINYMVMPSLFFILNLAFIHHPLLAILSKKDINFDLFYDRNMLTKNE
jgi:hypothetical protein